MEVPVVTVVTNEADDLKSWFRSVEKLTQGAVTAVPCVVNNGSSDGSNGVLWEEIRRKTLKRTNLFSLPTNYGFAAAQNHALRELGLSRKYDYFATLNIDATAKSDWLEKLVDAAKESQDRIGMWGGPVFGNDEYGDRVSSMGHYLRTKDGAFLDVDRNQPRHGHPLVSDDDDFVPFCPCFAAALWSFEMLKDIGLPDNDQFLYYDDVDLAYKARIKGWTANFVRGAIAFHTVPNSKKTHDQQRRMQLEGRLLIVERYFPPKKRDAALARLGVKERKVLDSIDFRRKKEFGTKEERAKVFKWARKREKEVKDMKKRASSEANSSEAVESPL